MTFAICSSFAPVHLSGIQQMQQRPSCVTLSPPPTLSHAATNYDVPGHDNSGPCPRTVSPTDLVYLRRLMQLLHINSTSIFFFYDRE